MSNHRTLMGASRNWWAPKPPRKSFASTVLAGVITALIIAGCATPPRVSTAEPAAAASANTASAATAEASQNASASGPQTGAPLDPENPTLVAQGVSATAPNAQPAYATKALDLLATLPIKGRAPKTGYDRALFGQAWADVDRNGCDTRNDMLRRDLAAVIYVNSVPCKVKSGTLADPYTGASISFLRGQTTSAAVQIDHVVALSDAWQKGAQQLSTMQRTAFANDPLNLQATDGPTNMKKGDGDAATWLPPNKGFRCEYVARQISVKATYGLWVTQAEHDAMTRILGDCRGQLAPTNALAPDLPPSPVVAEPAPAPVVPAPVAAVPAPAPVAPAPAPVPAAPAAVPAAPAPAAVYYVNCAAAKTAGAAPILAGQAGYRAGLDRDSDGVACEG